MDTITTTYLEMTDPAQLRPKTCNDPKFRIQEAETNDWKFNRTMYQIVGAEWAWLDKLDWTDEQWQSYAEDDAIRTFAAYYDGTVAGYFELSSRNNEVEIIYFGLTPEFIGKGLGGNLLTRAIEEAWKTNPDRVWVHTCDLDHDAALKNYEARGMTVYKTEKHSLATESSKDD